VTAIGAFVDDTGSAKGLVAGETGAFVGNTGKKVGLPVD
jgi:hypothetical protein